MRVLFIVPYPAGKAPSQRFRFEQYLDQLPEHGFSLRIQPFWDDRAWNILYKPGHVAGKVWGLLRGIGRRIALLASLHRYHYVFIHREAAPLGPPVLEWLIAKVWRKKIIYDFDDAIWLPNTSEVNQLAAWFKWHRKVASICRWAHKVSCGNDYLVQYARRYNPAAFLNPTTIDTEGLHSRAKPERQNAQLVIGWTGTHSTAFYLNALVPVLERLEGQYDFELSVISNQPPDFSLRSLRYIPWRKETEIADLLRFDVGLMPLTDDQWAKGKCGFKALQYMALGIPPLVSPVGVNTEIVDDGVNGFICHTPDEWERNLKLLLEEPALRAHLGRAARQKVVSSYSVRSNTASFLALFR